VEIEWVLVPCQCVDHGGPDKAPIPTPPPFPPFFPKQGCVYTETHRPTHFNPEDGGSMYFWNIGNVTHVHMVPHWKNRTNIDN
jgi:hypothetical protein